MDNLNSDDASQAVCINRSCSPACLKKETGMIGDKVFFIMYITSSKNQFYFFNTSFINVFKEKGSRGLYKSI